MVERTYVLCTIESIQTKHKYYKDTSQKDLVELNYVVFPLKSSCCVIQLSVFVLPSPAAVESAERDAQMTALSFFRQSERCTRGPRFT